MINKHFSYYSILLDFEYKHLIFQLFWGYNQKRLIGVAYISSRNEDFSLVNQNFSSGTRAVRRAGHIFT